MIRNFMQQKSWIHGFLLFIATLAVYLHTMPSTVALEDDGFFILSSYYSGISHPPGYPLHTLIGHLFTYIPLGTVAERIHAVSALFGALTVLVLFRLVLLITDKSLIAILAALGYAFSERFWSQAIIAEVYTLNTFLSFTLIYLTFKLVKAQTANTMSDKKNHLIALIGLVAGLGMANHWPLLILTIPGIVIIYGKFSKPDLRETLIFTAGLLAGLSPYIWMFFRSQQDPAFSFTGQLTTLQELVDHVLRRRYQGVDTSEISGFPEKTQFALFFVKQYIRQFTIIGFLLSITGFITIRKYLDSKQSLGMILVFLGNSLVLIALLGFEYTRWTEAVISVYFLTAYGIAAITMALGFDFLAELIASKSNKAHTGLVTSGFAVCVVGIVFIFNLQDNNRTDYIFAEQYARTIAKELPENAVIFTDSDISSGPLGYLQHIEKVRPDLKITNSKGLLFNSRLFDPKNTDEQTKSQLINAFIREHNNSIYTVEYMSGHELQEHWLYFKINGPGKRVDYSNPSNEVLAFYENHVFRNHYNDVWTKLFADRLKIRFIPYIIAMIEQNPQRAEQYLQYLFEASNSLEGMLAAVDFLESTSMAIRVLDQEKLNIALDEHYNNSTNRRSKAAYCNYKIKIALKNNDTATAKEFIKLSLSFNPENSNPAYRYKQEIMK